MSSGVTKQAVWFDQVQHTRTVEYKRYSAPRRATHARRSCKLRIHRWPTVLATMFEDDWMDPVRKGVSLTSQGPRLKCISSHFFSAGQTVLFQAGVLQPGQARLLKTRRSQPRKQCIRCCTLSLVACICVVEAFRTLVIIDIQDIDGQNRFYEPPPERAFKCHPAFAKSSNTNLLPRPVSRSMLANTKECAVVFCNQGLPRTELWTVLVGHQA